MSITSKTPIKNTVKKPVGIKNLDPLEWDFRGVNPDHLETILYYESERENPGLFRAKKLLTADHRKKIYGMDAETFAKHDLVSKNFGTSSKEEDRLFFVIAACWLCISFPKPWMALNQTERDEAARRYSKNISLRPNPVLRVLSRSELESIEASEEFDRRCFPHWKSPADSPLRHIIQIDWAKADDRTLNQLLQNLLKLRPPGIRPRKISAGKRVSVPLHKLKQLAAWRLKSAGHTHKTAKAIVKHRAEKHPMPHCHSDLLPNYNSAGAWSDAVKAGKKVALGF